MKTITVPKTEYVESWKVGYITLSATEVVEDGDNMIVTYEPLVIEETMTKTIQTATGEEEITIEKGTYKAPFDKS